MLHRTGSTAAGSMLKKPPCQVVSGTVPVHKYDTISFSGFLEISGTLAFSAG